MNWETVALVVAAVIGVIMITPVLVLAYIAQTIDDDIRKGEDKWKN